MLNLRFLGPPEIRLDDTVVCNLQRSEIATRLFAFLALHRQQSHLRTALADRFWPDLPETRAHRTLNNVLWRLRTLLGEAHTMLQSDSQQVQVVLHNRPETACWLDVDEFDRQSGDWLQNKRLFSANQIQEMVALYRGDLLEGVTDDWSLAPRQAWQQRYCQTLAHWVQHAVSSGDCEQALKIAQRWLEVDLYNESAHQQVIELLIANQQTQQAHCQFERFTNLWHDELKLPLSSQIVQWAGRIGLPNTSPLPSAMLVPLVPIVSAKNPAYLRREFEIRRKHDELCDLMADRTQQGENLLHLQQLADQLNDPLLQIDVLARRTWLAIRLGESDKAFYLAQVGLERYPTAQPGQTALLHRLLGIASEEMGNFKAARHHYKLALHVDNLQQDSHLVAADLNNLAAVSIASGYYQEASQALERAQHLLKVNPNPTIHLKVKGNVGFMRLNLGRLEEADEAFQQANALQQNVGDQEAAWWISCGRALLGLYRGQATQEITTLLPCYQAIQQSGDAWVQFLLAETLAKLYVATQDAQQTDHWATQALAHAQQKGNKRSITHGWMRCAEAGLLSQNFETAFAAITTALDHFGQSGQEFAEEPELYELYEITAVATNQMSIAKTAIQQRTKAIQRQSMQIADPPQRKEFEHVCTQRFAIRLSSFPQFPNLSHLQRILP